MKETYNSPLVNAIYLILAILVFITIVSIGLVAWFDSKHVDKTHSQIAEEAKQFIYPYIHTCFWRDNDC